MLPFETEKEIPNATPEGRSNRILANRFIGILTASCHLQSSCFANRAVNVASG